MMLESIYGVPVTGTIEQPQDILPAIGKSDLRYWCPAIRCNVQPIKIREFNTDYGLRVFFQCPVCRQTDGWHLGEIKP